MIRFINPGLLLYIERMRAEREYQDQQFRKRLKEAKLARAAVEEQGVGE